MENYNLMQNIKELLDASHKKCQITLNSEEKIFMSNHIKLFLERIHQLNIFNERIRNVPIYTKYWQKTKLRPDVPTVNDLSIILNNNPHIENGYFVVNGDLYENE